MSALGYTRPLEDLNALEADWLLAIRDAIDELQDEEMDKKK